jgi:hypothetical protein
LNEAIQYPARSVGPILPQWWGARSERAIRGISYLYEEGSEAVGPVAVIAPTLTPLSPWRPSQQTSFRLKIS